MRLGRILALAAVLAGGALARPAEAWGSYAHALIGERAYAELVPRHPWLAPQREAFLWGAVSADLEAPGEPEHRKRAHSTATLESLWKLAKKDPTGRAFALGWAVHVTSDQAAQSGFLAPDELERLRVALTKAGAHGLPNSLVPLAEWAVDADLLPLSKGTLRDIFDTTVTVVGTPAGGPIRDMLAKVLGLDDDAYWAWARLLADETGSGPDHYLEAHAQLLGVQPWTDALRAPEVRQSLGDLPSELARTVHAGVERAEAMLATSKRENPRLPGYHTKTKHPERKL